MINSILKCKVSNNKKKLLIAIINYNKHWLLLREIFCPSHPMYFYIGSFLIKICVTPNIAREQ
jgi:hypothetical protein